MVGLFTILSEDFKLKQPKKSKKNIFTICSPKKETIEKADTLAIDTVLSVKVPENVNVFLATKFEGQENKKLLVQLPLEKGFG